MDPENPNAAQGDAGKAAGNGKARKRFCIPRTPVRGKIVRVEDYGFGVVELEGAAGSVQYGFFSIRTELFGRPSKKLKVGAVVEGILEATDRQIPVSAGAPMLPIKELRLVS